MWMDLAVPQPPTTLRLQRGLCVLRTLAHLGCGHFGHLHTICFPGGSQSTMRLVLHDLERVHYILRSQWRLTHDNERGSVWTITRDGLAFLAQREDLPPTRPLLDLGRPSTRHESAAWQARLQIRTVLARLILEVRQYPLVAWLSIVAGDLTSAAPFGAPRIDPDALVSVVWHPPLRQGPDWLPWETPAPSRPVTYAMYVLHEESVPVLDAMLARAADEQTVPVLMCCSDAQRLQLLERVAALPAVRLTTHHALGSAFAESWWDRTGQSCSLELTPEEQLRAAGLIPSP